MEADKTLTQRLLEKDTALRKKQEALQQDIQCVIQTHGSTHTECFTSMIALVQTIQEQRKILREVIEEIDKIKHGIIDNL